MEQINTNSAILSQGLELHLPNQKILKLPPELTPQILSYLPSKDVAASSLICKSFKTMIYGDALLNLKRIGDFFGGEDWNTYFGNIGAEPPLPSNIEQILNTQCTFWPDKKVKETHLLVLVPQTVDGKPFCLDTLGELIRSPKTGHKTQYRCYSDDVKKELGTQSVASHWVLMTRDVIPNSRNEGYEEQKSLVASHAKKRGVPYLLPKTLDAITAIVMHYVETGERLYPGRPLTYTRCQETVCKGKYPVVVGGFGAGGPALVGSDGWFHDLFAVGAAEVLFGPGALNP